MPQSISAEPLVQMVRSIMLQKRTGVLRVEQLGGRGAERGEIYFENGSLVRARTEREAGKAALQRINEWKQITCAFQSISRLPYPGSTSGEVTSSSKAVPSPARVLPQTDPLARMPELRDGEARERRAGLPARPASRTTRPLNPRRVEIALSARTQASMLPAQQPLVLRGTQLEAYTPAPPPASLRFAQRWTTHLDAEPGSPLMPRTLPATPQLAPMPDEETLPGRMAVFKTCPTISPAEAIQQMERRARLVFILVDGRRTIQDIARLTHQAEYDVERILMDLMRCGYTQYTGN